MCPGRLCRSFVSFLFFFLLLFSPYPSLYIQTRRCDRFPMRLGFIGFCPLHLVPPLILSLVCARIGPGLSVCARTFNPGSRSRFDNEVGFIVYPCALGSFSSQPHTLLSPLVLFSCLIFLSLLRACAFVLTLVFLPSPHGRRVCVLLGVTRIHSDCFWKSRGPGLPAWRVPWPTKTGRQGGENVPAIVKLLIGCCGPLVCFMVVHVPDVVPGGV